MSALAGSFYLVSTVAFCVCCLVIGVRLLRLASRTGGRPERLLGLALGLTGGVGYGLLIIVSLARQANGNEYSSLLTLLGLVGKASHDIGVLFFLGFVLSVFRPTERWARVLAGAMALVLLAGYVGNAVTGGFSRVDPGGRLGFWYWVGFSVIGSYPLWLAAEAFRYHGLMRKRRALGLADPIVVNRFLMWGMASTFAVAAIWTVSLPALVGLPLEEQRRWSPFVLSLTGLWGMGCVFSYWLTFFPPAWYRARIAASAG